jgi:hypothetical protein
MMNLPLFKCVHREADPWPWRVYSYFCHDPYDICDTEPSTPKCDTWCVQMWGDPGHVYLLMEGGWQFKHEADARMFMMTWS